MAWPTKTQFQPVERLPVSPEVNQAFKKLESAHVGAGYAGGRGVEARMKAAAKVEAAAGEAAQHFEGDVGRMTTHFKRWQRWGGTMMSPAGLMEEVVGRTMQNVEKRKMENKIKEDDAAEQDFKRGARLTKPSRRVY